MNRRLSQATEKLIASLYEKDSFWRQLLPFDSQLNVIAKIESAGEPAAILDLLPVAISRSEKAAVAAAAAIDRLLHRLNPDDYAGFDELARRSYSNWRPHREPWYAIKPSDVPYIAGLPDAPVSLLGIASWHDDGHVREAAIRQLAKTENGAELPFLLLRANDWVPAIRSLVKDLLAIRIQPVYARHYLAWLPLVLRLGRARRGDHSQLTEAILLLLRSPEAWPALQEGFASQHRIVRRFCYDAALSADHPERARLLRRAFAERDPRIRLAAAASLRTRPPSDEMQSLLAFARNDSCAPIRREALHTYAEKYYAQAHREFHGALLDGSPSIRELAQAFMRKETGFDLRSFYAKAMGTAEGIEKVGAILGLGETGLAGDAVLIAPFVENARPRIRLSALRALARLAPDQHLETFLRALEDSSQSVSREASLALARSVTSVGGPRLWAIFERCQFSHGRRAALFLLARLSKWDSAGFLIQALGDRDEAVTALSMRYIARWLARYNRTFTPPTGEQIASLRSILIRYDLLVGRELRRELESMLQSFQRS
jgi:hypothetical protein